MLFFTVFQISGKFLYEVNFRNVVCSLHFISYNVNLKQKM
jgi:hypothetical protein